MQKYLYLKQIRKKLHAKIWKYKQKFELLKFIKQKITVLTFWISQKRTSKYNSLYTTFAVRVFSRAYEMWQLNNLHIPYRETRLMEVGIGVYLFLILPERPLFVSSFKLLKFAFKPWL